METWKAFEQNVCDKCGEMSGYNSWQRLNDSKEVKGERGWFNSRCKYGLGASHQTSIKFCRYVAAPKF